MGTPLARKLGIREGARVQLEGVPAGFEAALGELPAGVRLLSRSREPVDVAICFCPDRVRLARRLGPLRDLLDPDGGLWIAWPKKSSGMTTDVEFAAVQRAGLELGLVDNKVCAIDETWSALRFVYRLTDRPGGARTR